MSIYYSPDKGLVVNKLPDSRANESKHSEENTTDRPESYYWDTYTDWVNGKLATGQVIKDSSGNIVHNAGATKDGAMENYNKVAEANKIANSEGALANLQAKNANKEIDEHKANVLINAAYDKTVATLETSQGGDYVDRRAGLRTITDVNNTVKKEIEAAFRAAYIEKHIAKNKWKPTPSSKPPYGDFDYEYYRKQN